MHTHTIIRKNGPCYRWVPKDVATCIIVFEKTHIVNHSREHTIDQRALHFVFIVVAFCLYILLLRFTYITFWPCNLPYYCYREGIAMVQHAHTHKGKGEGMCYSRHYYWKHIHTHIRGGGRNVVIIERTLLLTIVVV